MRTDSVPHNIWTVDADLVRKYNGWRLFGSRISAGAALISGFAIVCVVLGWKNAEIISSAIGSILIGLGALLGFWYQQKIFVNGWSLFGSFVSAGAAVISVIAMFFALYGWKETDMYLTRVSVVWCSCRSIAWVCVPKKNFLDCGANRQLQNARRQSR